MNLQQSIASTESHNSITSVVVAAVANASKLEIELWFSVFALVLLQFHCNPRYCLRWEWRKYFTYSFSLHESVSLQKLFWTPLAVFSWRCPIRDRLNTLTYTRTRFIISSIGHHVTTALRYRSISRLLKTPEKRQAGIKITSKDWLIRAKKKISEIFPPFPP